MLSRCDTIPEHGRWTDRQIDGQNSYQYRVSAVPTRDEAKSEALGREVTIVESRYRADFFSVIFRGL